MHEEDSCYFSLDVDSKISILKDQVESYECEYVAASFPKVCDYFSLQQRMVVYMRSSVQMNSKKLEVYDEA